MDDIKKLSPETVDEVIKKEFSVLFVEDNKMIRDSILRGLELMFSKVVVVKDGQEAIKVVKEDKFDFILTDMHMPVMDGVDLIMAVRESCKIMPIIITTAFSEFTEVYRDIPNIYVIEKPYSIYDIIVTVEKLEKQHKIIAGCAFKQLEDASKEAKKVLELLRRA